MTNKSLVTASHLRFFMALKRQNHTNGMKGSEIADERNPSRPSVYHRMDTFIFMEHLEKEPGGQVFLTDYGFQRASFFEERYNKIKKGCFLNDKQMIPRIVPFAQGLRSFRTSRRNAWHKNTSENRKRR